MLLNPSLEAVEPQSLNQTSFFFHASVDLFSGDSGITLTSQRQNQAWCLAWGKKLLSEGLTSSDPLKGSRSRLDPEEWAAKSCFKDLVGFLSRFRFGTTTELYQNALPQHLRAFGVRKLPVTVLHLKKCSRSVGPSPKLSVIKGIVKPNLKGLGFVLIFTQCFQSPDFS